MASFQTHHHDPTFPPIQDVNDNAPVFDESPYRVTLAEDTAVGTEIITVRATDQDIGLNGLVSYQVGFGLEIQNETGVVTLAVELDFETLPEEGSAPVSDFTTQEAGSPHKILIMHTLYLTASWLFFTLSNFLLVVSRNFCNCCYIHRSTMNCENFIP